jgi:hypothetical protein
MGSSAGGGRGGAGRTAIRQKTKLLGGVVAATTAFKVGGKTKVVFVREKKTPAPT